MSEIDIDVLRHELAAVQSWFSGPAMAQGVFDRTQLALDQLAKENERLTAENSMLAAGTCINPNGNGLLGDDHGNSYCGVERDRVALDEQVTDLMARLNEATAKLAAMQEAIATAVRRADEMDAPAFVWPTRHITEPLRSHLPTPEPEPVDLLLEAMKESQRFVIREDDVDKLRAALSARGLEVRKIGEGA